MDLEVGAGWADERELLDRHRPVLRFDPQYDYRVLAAESAVGNTGNILRRFDGEVIARAGGVPPLGITTLSAYPGGLAARSDDSLAMAPDHVGAARRMEWEEPHRGRIYGRVREDGGRIWLQYWFWLYYNPKNLLGFGKHEGDWEMIQLGLGSDGKPELATYAQHDSGEARPWQSGEIEFSADDPQRPVVYVAPLSHASYFEPYTHPYILGIDHPYPGPFAELPVVPFGPWAEWRGRWGSTERTIGGRIGSGPRSPGLQNPKWEHPGAWHARISRRRWRTLLGRRIHRVGELTYPVPPRITELAETDESVHVSWKLEGRGLRTGRHLHITLHERHFVIASRIVVDAEPAGATTMLVPHERRPTSLMASAYNRLRQRSDVAEARLGQPGAADRPREGDE